jgi:hypothetical protein
MAPGALVHPMTISSSKSLDKLDVGFYVRSPLMARTRVNCCVFYVLSKVTKASHPRHLPNNLGEQIPRCLCMTTRHLACLVGGAIFIFVIFLDFGFGIFDDSMSFVP